MLTHCNHAESCSSPEHPDMYSTPSHFLSIRMPKAGSLAMIFNKQYHHTPKYQTYPKVRAEIHGVAVTVLYAAFACYQINRMHLDSENEWIEYTSSNRCQNKFDPIVVSPNIMINRCVRNRAFQGMLQEKISTIAWCDKAEFLLLPWSCFFSYNTTSRSILLLLYDNHNSQKQICQG